MQTNDGLRSVVPGTPSAAPCAGTASPSLSTGALHAGSTTPSRVRQYCAVPVVARSMLVGRCIRPA
eukprot:3941608-Rhodomonas_salina.3